MVLAFQAESEGHQRMTPAKALEEAADIVGGKSELARRLGISPQSFNGWERCPKKHVAGVVRIVAEALAKRPITAHDLRPDLYPQRP